MRLVIRIFVLLAFAALPAAAETVLPGIVREVLSVATSQSGRQVVLQGLVIRPSGPGPFPLIVLVHGTPRSEPGKHLEAYAKMSPVVLEGPALTFAQRGFAAVTILRRGFGRSDGPYAEFISDPCDSTDYLPPARASAEDVVGAVEALRKEKWVDGSRVLLLGHSTGGLAVIAAGATNPVGVVGIVNFAGGRGSFRQDEVCSPDRLVEAFQTFGASSRIPTLWALSENDHYLGSRLGRRLFDAYTSAGGTGRFEMLPPYGADGHLALIAAPSELWWPHVERFLTDLRLPTSIAVSLPPLAQLRRPTGLNDACTAFFNRYLGSRTDAKAFATGAEGHCASIPLARTVDDAKREAMLNCQAAWKDCALFAVGHEVVDRQAN